MDAKHSVAFFMFVCLVLLAGTLPRPPTLHTPRSFLDEDNVEVQQPARSKSLVQRLREQLTLSKVYTSLAAKDTELVQQLRTQTKELEKLLADVEGDGHLDASAESKLQSFNMLLESAKSQYYECNNMLRKLSPMIATAAQEAEKHKKKSSYLSQIAAQNVPKGHHCLAMALNLEYLALPPESRKLPRADERTLEDNGLYHYALFTDNLLAASVVVNSAVVNAKEPEKHVFHLVTDNLHYGAMKMWFLANPPGNASIEVQNVDDFEWLNSSYSPVLSQSESPSTKEYYFQKAESSATSDLKYRNPKYLLILNHLRFYLPQLYPKLDKIVFLDDDVVVQRDLTRLWSIDMKGNVNGAVETCGDTFHRFDRYLNFSDPLITENFDSNGCGWGFGMNVFDLREWRHRGLTELYHKWQNLNQDRTLWKLGTLPPGLIVFNNLTYPLDKQWHLLGLGHSPKVKEQDILAAAVVHYNGNLKPWLDIAIPQYKGYWTPYVKYDSALLQECNVK